MTWIELHPSVKRKIFHFLCEFIYLETYHHLNTWNIKYDDIVWYSQLKIMCCCVGLTFWGTLRTPTMRMENLIRIHPLLSPLMFDMTKGQCRFHCGILWNWGNFSHSSKLSVSLWKQHRKYEKRCHKHMDFLQCGERALTGVIYCSIWTGSK